MNTEIRRLLEGVQQGIVSVEDALLQLKLAPFEELGYAKVDHHRRIRQGNMEVVYGAGKTPEQIIGILSSLSGEGEGPVLVTRLSQAAADQDGFRAAERCQGVGVPGGRIALELKRLLEDGFGGGEFDVMPKEVRFFFDRAILNDIIYGLEEFTECVLIGVLIDNQVRADARKPMFPAGGPFLDKRVIEPFARLRPDRFFGYKNLNFGEAENLIADQLVQHGFDNTIPKDRILRQR